MSRPIDTGYMHTRELLEEYVDNIADTSNRGDARVMIGRVGLVLAERLEAIVNVLEEMEKRL